MKLISLLLSLSSLPFSAMLFSCASANHSVPAQPVLPPVTVAAPGLLASYTLTGDTQPVHDPSMIRQGSTYYVFSTDIIGAPASNWLSIRCSQDRIAWTPCGHVFSQAPAWVRAGVPGIQQLWAPDVSYYNGLYHLYYAGSTLGSQQSVIGLATNTTLDATDPAYRWIDRGEVLASRPGDDFNAIDPNILADADGRVWMSYGSYWTGIKQQEIDPATGMLLASNPQRYDLAARPDTPAHPIEGASMVIHNGYYYLFVSIDYCCNPDISTDNYKQAVGRSSSIHGPFVDQQGNAMLSGGSTVLLQTTGRWLAPGGGSAYIDAQTGESTFTFHALDTTQNGALMLWVAPLKWVNDWPSLN